MRLKTAVLSHYSPTDPASCECCGETELECLTVDHINGDGAAHRREVSGGSRQGGVPYYRWLWRNGYPAEVRLRVLCQSCNLSARNADGVCVHQRRLQHVLTGGHFSRIQF